MKILAAGATGVLGKQLITRLVAAGHEVAGMTRSESKLAGLQTLGAEPVIDDALNPDQVADGQVQRINSIVNPDKLAHLGPVASLKTLLERSAAPGDSA